MEKKKKKKDFCFSFSMVLSFALNEKFSMGCGASVDIAPVAIASNTKMANFDVPQTTTGNLCDLLVVAKLNWSYSVHSVSSAITTKILIASHTTQQAISERLRQGLVGQNLSCYILNESTPSSLSARANIIQWCDVFVVLISRLYQRTRFCTEAIIYAKDTHKPVIVIYAEPTFRPYGALGAIATSAARSIILKDDSSLVHAVSDIAKTANAQVTKKADAVNVIDPIQVKKILHYALLFTFYLGEQTWGEQD